MITLSRRRSIALFGGLGAFALPSAFMSMTAQALSPPPLRPLLPKPQVLGVKDALSAGPVTFPDGQSGFGYNGTIPGPTIRARRGDTFRVKVVNGLEHDTTVHWHGLLPPPAMDGQPHDAIAPGTDRDYHFEVAQRAGLNWYHPHPHGATAAQAWQGLAGLFIVEDAEEDRLDLPKGESELLLVLRDAQIKDQGLLSYVTNIAGNQGEVPLVNGVAWPRTTLPQGFARLRILNGANARVFRLGCKAPMTVIGNDGGLIDHPQTVSEVELAPAERVDLLLDLRGFKTGEQIELTCLAADWSLLAIEVGLPSRPDWEIPPRLSQIAPLQHEGAPDREFVFQENEQINGSRYDVNRIDFAVAFGKTERWRFISARGAPHPVHVHGAHFQVLSGTAPNGRIREVRAWERGWKDTVHVRTHETVDVLVRFDAHQGRYLLHCHKLEHEDHGMMMNFIVATDPVRAMEKAELERLYGPLCFADV